MNVTAHIHVKRSHEILFSTDSGKSHVSCFLKGIKEASFIDHIYVWIEPTLKGSLEALFEGVKIREIPADVHNRSGFPEADLFREVVESSMGLDDTGVGDVFLYIDPAHLLFSADHLENMFDKLLEDEQIHVIYPTYKVDPHIYMKTSVSQEYYPVWEYPGLDRQKYPGLYRKVGIYMFHAGRQRYKQPMRERYYQIPWAEGKKYLNLDDMGFVEYMLLKKNESGGAK